MDSFVGHGGAEVTAVAPVPSSPPTVFASCGEDGTVRQWDIRASCGPNPQIDLSSGLPTRNLSDIVCLSAVTGCVIGEQYAMSYDVRRSGGAKGNSASSSVLATYRHPVDLEALGKTFTLDGVSDGVVSTDGEPPLVAIVDEDGSVMVLRGETLKLHCAPFGAHGNIGCGLCVSSGVGTVASAGMDNVVKLYQRNPGGRVFTEVASSSIDGSTTGVPAPTTGPQRCINPPLATSLDASWPYFAVARADGSFVVLEASSSSSTSDHSMEFVMSSTGCPRGGLCTALWQPTARRNLCTVGLSGAVALWDVQPMFAPVEQAAESSSSDGRLHVDETPRCLYCVDLRGSGNKVEGLIPNGAAFLSADLLVVADSAGRLTCLTLRP